MHSHRSLTFHLVLGSSNQVIKDVERPLVSGLANRPRLLQQIWFGGGVKDSGGITGVPLARTYLSSPISVSPTAGEEISLKPYKVSKEVKAIRKARVREGSHFPRARKKNANPPLTH